ncbi:MAG: alanine--tRNA ligase [Alphaproteobacteria bacterium]|nr:alanine--tRNA ligase [Alphaproteobacteria bacterium]
MKTVSDIRNEFLSYFASKGHEVVKSSPLVPQNDPTLMFANAGMNQFKNIFTGAETRPYKRATTAQKCVRAGGKHNDLENVGYTARHHTFFEMMGNFSFGDYFKEEAISYAWELVSKNFGLPRDKLLVTVYHEDEEAAGLWKKIAGFADEKIIRIPTYDNFWMMGDTGPCGPCTEIFIDQGESLAGGPPGSPDEDGDRFLEFWNLVFMQFEQEPDGQGDYIRKPLPKPSIDTGMGLERTAAIMQGKFTNYDVDLLRAIIEHSADLTGVSPDGDQAPSHRVIADHLRAATFLMADGVMPSNEGRGYVLRRIMRRGMRHAHLLGAQEPLMYRLVPTLTGMMGEAYPEIVRAQALVTETLNVEETRFKRTLDRGLKMLDEEAGKVSGGKLAGDVAFKLYDTYGFPVDLTADALKAKGLAVDMKGFEACMDKQRADARKSWSGSGDAALDKLWFEILDEVGPTDFLGYETEHAEGIVRAILVCHSERSEESLPESKGERSFAGAQDDKKIYRRSNQISKGEEGYVILNQTPFYAESGGQIGDTGAMKTAGGAVLTVLDTHKQVGKLWAHRCRIEQGSLKTGETAELEINSERRAAIRANHSATHLLHAALHRIVGEHVTQKGSLVAPDRLRFDVALNQALTGEQIKAIEEMVNAEIWANTEVCTRLMGIEEAMQCGAMALFGEKYDEEVRVLTMGRDDPARGRPYSVELCGGTHVRRTGDIGLFKLTSDSALSAGVRRIEGVTRSGALALLNDEDMLLHTLARSLNVAIGEIPDRVKTLAEEKRKLEKQVADLRRQLATGGGGASSGPEIKDIGGVKFTGKVLDGFPPKDLKPMADDLKKKLGSGVIALVAVNEGKASIVVGVTDDLTGKVSAVDLVKIGAEALGGSGGGGRPDMAQAGGPNADAANDAVAAIEGALAG